MNSLTDLTAAIHRTAEAVRTADALMITAGAGMGVDSGLPDFRGTQGFWRAYPRYEQLRLDFMSVANPEWFHRDPTMAWGFYGHRLNLYRAAVPHEGFAILRRWGERMKHGAFVFTSNVDGHFQKAGFDTERIMEVHGAIDYLQCVNHCGAGIFPTPYLHVAIDEETTRASELLPRCPKCAGLARPNILMFGDSEWDEERTVGQQGRLTSWLSQMERGRMVVIECGAGLAIPTVRRFSEGLVRGADATLVRINVRECEVPAGQIGLPLGALEALRAMDQSL